MRNEEVLGKTVCLQINVAAFDVRHTVNTLPHQLRVFANQVDEIQFTLDTRHLHTSKFKTDHFEVRLESMRAQLRSLCAEYRHAYITEVDYTSSRHEEVSRQLKGGAKLPLCCYSGSPFYSYIYGPIESKCDYILHLDSDMLFGGGSQTWVEEAISVLESRSGRYMSVMPIAGPPFADGSFEHHNDPRAADLPYPAYEARGPSTRIYLVNRRQMFLEAPLPHVRARGKRWAQAMVNNLPPYLHLEECFTELFVSLGKLRLDMLGTGAGIWSLHPPYRSDRFYEMLPTIISRVEAGDVPDGQRGHYDVNDSFVDWSDVRPTVASGIRRYAGYAVAGIRNRLGWDAVSR